MPLGTPQGDELEHSEILEQTQVAKDVLLSVWALTGYRNTLLLENVCLVFNIVLIV